MSKLKEAIEYYDIYLEHYNIDESCVTLSSNGFNVLIVDRVSNLIGVEGIENPVDIFPDMGYRYVDGDYRLIW